MGPQNSKNSQRIHKIVFFKSPVFIFCTFSLLFCRLFCFKQKNPQQNTACHYRQAAAQKNARTLLQVQAFVSEFAELCLLPEPYPVLHPIYVKETLINEFVCQPG